MTILLVPLIMNIETTVLNILHIKLTLDKFTYGYCALKFSGFHGDEYSNGDFVGCDTM
jgi:hypothetical protein